MPDPKNTNTNTNTNTHIQHTFNMKAVDYARSLSILPASNSYDNVRPHHLALGYAILGVLTSSKICKKISGKILNMLSDLSEACIPLIHVGLVPDFVIRWGIRLQLR